MDSVLLIGSEFFTASVTAQVRGLEALTTTAVITVSEAIALMQKALPDVVVVQASQLTEGSVLKTFSQERYSVYFVVLDESDELVLTRASSCAQIVEAAHDELSTPTLSAQTLSAQTLSAQALSAQTLEDRAERYIEKKVIALEAGADAYLLLLPAKAQQLEENARACRQMTACNGASASVSTVSPITAPIVFRKSQQRLIQAYIQIGLNRAQRYRDLSRINDWLSAVALVDALTQLSNRRSFDIELPRQIKVARTKNTPLSLMVIDIDFFKSVNDRYGHLVGDDVLKLMAKRLLANMRFYDTPFRYGGEEFVITLINTDLTEGMAIAQRLRHSIDQEPFKITQGVSATRHLPLTVSIGLTELRDSDDLQGRSFLHRADQYLLQAKASGRNQVVSDQT